MATQNASQPKQPRRPVLFHCRDPIQEDCVAVIRFSWFRKGRVKQVEEFVLWQADEETDWLEILCNICIEALGRGADVSLIGPWTLEDLGICEEA